MYMCRLVMHSLPLNYRIVCMYNLSFIHTAGQPSREGLIMAGPYALPDRVFLPIVNPDDEIALEDNVTIEYSLQPVPEFQSDIEFGAVLGNEQTFQTTNLIIIDDDSETKYTSLGDPCTHLHRCHKQI